MTMRVAFCGTPGFSIPSLDAVVSAGHEVSLVVSQPDRKRGRRAAPTPSPLRSRALDLSLPTRCLERGRRSELYRELIDLDLDVVIVVAFGHIIREPLLSAARFGCLNVHASLLPRWRGPAPIHRAILAGDGQTGVCTMKLAEGVDTGDLYLRRATKIDESEDAGSLHDRLAQLGGEVLVETLRGLESGTLSATPQAEDGVTYAPLLERCEGSVDFGWSSRRIHNRIRGLHPWPATTVLLGDRGLKLGGSRVIEHRGSTAAPGTVVDLDDEMMSIACGEGIVGVATVQPAGRRAMTPAECARGSELSVGSVLRPMAGFCPRPEEL